MPEPKFIIGLAGGIGSGKSTVARIMGDCGGFVIDADSIAKQTLSRPEVIEQLAAWWGEGVLDDGGAIDRAKVAEQIFDNETERERLEGLIHPLVAAERERLIEAANADPEVRFIVLDVPLLYEVGLDQACDRVVFVEADRAVRLDRVRKTRGWDEAELARREKNQIALDKKRMLAHNVVDNSSSEDACSTLVRQLLESFPLNNR